MLGDADLVDQLLGGDVDDQPTAEELAEAEDLRREAMRATAATLRARSRAGALLHTLLALDDIGALDGQYNEKARVRMRRRAERMLYAVAHYLAGPAPDADAQTLLDHFAPAGFDVAARLERLRTSGKGGRVAG